jgi:hypothetical protein
MYAPNNMYALMYSGKKGKIGKKKIHLTFNLMKPN